MGLRFRIWGRGLGCRVQVEPGRVPPFISSQDLGHPSFGGGFRIEGLAFRDWVCRGLVLIVFGFGV